MLVIRQGRQRQDSNTLVAAREKGPVDTKKRIMGRVGGGDGNPKSQYLSRPNLTAAERQVGYARKPPGKIGSALRYNYSAHSGYSKWGLLWISPHPSDTT